MRSLLVAALLMLALLPLPGAAAAPALDDPEGDPQLSVFGLGAAAAPASMGEPADLKSLELIEDAEELTFVLAVK